MKKESKSRSSKSEKNNGEVDMDKNENEIVNLETILIPSIEIFEMASQDQEPKSLDYKRSEFKELERGRDKERGTFYYKDVNARMVNNQHHFRCRVDYWNRLRINNGTFAAKGLAYYFSSIQWSAGRHWPVYSNRCPLNDTSPKMLFPAAKRHMLVVQYGGYYWDSCSNSGAGVGKEITDIFVGVNDDGFSDNTGSFELIVTAYSQ